MKIISWNVNGIRAVERKGELEKLLAAFDPDIFVIQETKAKVEQLTPFVKKYIDYEQFYHEAEKPGYAGTGVWVKKSSFGETVSFHSGMPDFEDTEGRVVRCDIAEYSILGVYFPNGGKSSEAWDGKLVFYDLFLSYVNQLRSQGRKVIWGGDVNCAHEEIDLARPKENRESIGFLPEERAWVSRVVGEGWTDVFRSQYPEKVMYSWWHVISRARLRNVGWRIDYWFVDEALMGQVEEIEYLNDQMGSDHCPLLLKFGSSGEAL